jgi:hypothetical protein
MSQKRVPSAIAYGTHCSRIIDVSQVEVENDVITDDKPFLPLVARPLWTTRPCVLDRIVQSARGH